MISPQLFSSDIHFHHRCILPEVFDGFNKLEVVLPVKIHCSLAPEIQVMNVEVPCFVEDSANKSTPDASAP